MARRMPALYDVVQLRVPAYAIVAHQQSRGDLGMGRNEPPHERCDGVGAVGKAENDLVFGIVEDKNGGERLPRERFHSA